MLSKIRQTLVTVSAASVVALLVGTSTAHAGDEFKHAFEHQLGRIAAIQVAHLGQAALFGATYHAPYWSARYHHRHPARYHRHDRHFRRHGHFRPHRHARTHRHDRAYRHDRVRHDFRRHVHGPSFDVDRDHHAVREHTVEKTVKKGRRGARIVTTRRDHRDR